MGDFVLRSAEFRREREETWRELQTLVQKAERGGVRSLGRDELARLPSLYRSVISSLSVARAVSLDRNLLDYLTNLACRSYILVYGTKRSPARTILRFFTHRLPQTVRRAKTYLAASVLCLVAGTLCGYCLVVQDVERYYALIPSGLSDGRDPSASTEELHEVLYPQKESALHALQLFATFLFTNNAGVGILCFALGFAAGVPVVLLLFYNGLMLGALAALYQGRGLGLDFWGWVLPHGVTELLAVCLCGMTGLVLGMAVVFPGERSRLDNLGRRGREAAVAVIGAILMLFVAAGIEGFFRQLVHHSGVRWAVALATLAFWIWYFGFVGRGETDGR